MLTLLLQSPLLIEGGFGSFPVGGVNDFILLAVKLMLVMGALLYLVFAFVVTRQITVMRSTVITPFSGMVGLLGFIHLLSALAVLVLFITVL